MERVALFARDESQKILRIQANLIFDSNLVFVHHVLLITEVIC